MAPGWCPTVMAPDLAWGWPRSSFTPSRHKARLAAAAQMPRQGVVSAQRFLRWCRTAAWWIVSRTVVHGKRDRG